MASALKKLNRKLELDAREIDHVIGSAPVIPSRRVARTLKRLETHMREGEKLLAGLDSGGSKAVARSNRAELERLRLLIEVVHQLSAGARISRTKDARTAMSAAGRSLRKWKVAKRAQL